MTVGGHEGCYFAEYGCPDHSHSLPKVGLIHHDAYAEHSLNALHNEHNCLSRAFPQYRYCGSHVDYPYTSIFLPTGIALLSFMYRLVFHRLRYNCGCQGIQGNDKTLIWLILNKDVLEWYWYYNSKFSYFNFEFLYMSLKQVKLQQRVVDVGFKWTHA